MKKNLKFRVAIPILLIISVFFISCKSKNDENKKKLTPEEELQVAPENGFSQTYFFPNNTFTPQKEILPNNDILLHPEIYLKGMVEDVKSHYDVTIITDYYDNVNVEDCKFAVTAISPDTTSRRSQQYKIVFNDKQDKVISSEGEQVLKRNTRVLFKDMKFSSAGEAQFKVALAPGHGRFSFSGIKSVSVKVEKVKEELES